LLELDESTSHEIAELAQYLELNPVQERQRDLSDLRLDRCRDTFEQAKAKLDHGVGFVVVDRLALDRMTEAVAVELFWILGQLVGRPVAQKWNGQMIYEVKDTGESYSYGVRGSITNSELVFHTDNAFAQAIPDYVGLLCIRPAMSGGVSRVCSLYTVHEKLETEYGSIIRRLYEPMYFDRQKEHAVNAPAVTLAPFFSWRGDQLYARANTSLVRKAYDLLKIDLDEELHTALNAVDAVCNAGDIWFEGTLDRGQLQYLNNHEIAHYRSAFKDSDEPEMKRHLYRMWHRDRGAVCYDGIQFGGSA